MSEDNKKIGQIISDIRIEKQLTQKGLAELLGTSQSAVNRIENGKQNLSIDTIAKISKVLDREILRVSTGAKISFEITGQRELSGEITTNVSKNAMMGLLNAALLNKGVTVFERVPKIEEVYRVVEVMESIGVEVNWKNGNSLEIKPPKKLNLSRVNKKSARRTRTAIMLLAPLMHELKEFDIPFSGGCKLGERTVRPHIFGLEEFGLKVKTTNGNYKCTVDELKSPGEVIAYEAGDTVTENLIMAAARTPGKTVIKYISSNYMVQDLCFYLQKLGVKIEGVGTTTLTVYGKKNIDKRVKFSPSEDPIESMALITAAAATNSSITIKRCPVNFLELEMLRLEKMGYKLTLSDVYKSHNGCTNLVDITTHKYDKLYALEDKIEAKPYPGINIDNLPFFVLIASLAKGETLIHDWVYENRAIYYTELNKLGADVKLADQHRAFVSGAVKLKAADVMSPGALRPAVVLMLAMLGAQGTSRLRDVYMIRRGYEGLAKRLNALGADIKIIRDI